MTGLLAQTSDGGSWPTAAVAFGAALIGGLLGALGSRWATRRDLIERNRHALLMEDLPRYRSATKKAAEPSSSGGTREWQARDAVVAEARDQIYARTRILSAGERRLGVKAKMATYWDEQHEVALRLTRLATKHTTGWRRRATDWVIDRWPRRQSTRAQNP